MLDRNAFRIIFSIIWVGSVTYDVIYQPRLGHEWYIYKLIMLTNLNFILVTVYSVLVALSCIDSLKSLLKPVTDFMFYTSVFPVGIVTCALFWGLYVIDPALVMPAWIAKLIPQWLNHVTHTLPVFYLLFEIYSTHREAPTKTTSMIMSSLLVAIYFAIILFIRAVDGYWIYPLLSLFEVEHFLLGYVAGLFGFYGLIRSANLLTTLKWRNQKKRE